MAWIDDVETASHRHARHRSFEQITDAAGIQFEDWLDRLAGEVSLVPAALRRAGKDPNFALTGSFGREFRGWRFEMDPHRLWDHSLAIDWQGQFCRLRVVEARQRDKYKSHEYVTARLAGAQFFGAEFETVIELMASGRVRSGFSPVLGLSCEPSPEERFGSRRAHELSVIPRPPDSPLVTEWHEGYVFATYPASVRLLEWVNRQN